MGGDKIMNKEFRDGVSKVGEKGLKILDEFLDGKREGTDKVREASKMITNAIKIEHINQIQEYSNKSLGLRLIQYLPKDEKLRKKYIQMTNPEIQTLLLERPKK